MSKQAAKSMPPLRILIVAPFERGLGHGGSQRATALAERLEDRGAKTEWMMTSPVRTSRVAKIAAAVRLRPSLVDLHSAELDGLERPPDAAIAAHSYLAPQLDGLASGVVRVLDFHNLEWRHLEDAAAHEAAVRRPYSALQIALMRRFERRAIAAASLSVFVSEEELSWAAAAAPRASLCLAPSVLPQAAEREALETAGSSEPSSELAYVGTLRFPPNLRALIAFLRDAWPAVRAANPGLRLTVAGDCSEEDRRAINAFAGVEAIGFIADIRTLLRRSLAVIMPIEARAGTSLRALYCALARVWVIGTPAAFRGLPWEMGQTVRSSAQWAEAIADAAAASGGERRRRRLDTAHSAALAVQRDATPWDTLYRRIAEASLVATRDHGSGE